MKTIPNQLPIEALIENKLIEVKHRPYLGYSQLGHSCEALLWFTFRWTYKKKVTPRLMRLWQRGHKEEALIISDLEREGVICKNTLNNQLEVSGTYGHAKSRIDGTVEKLPGAPKTIHLLEIKTTNTKSYRDFKKRGVAISKYIYYLQMQMYMGKLGLTHALFIATCKENDERYYEQVPFDKAAYEEGERKAERVVLSDKPLLKISNRPDYYECRYCSASDVCHKNLPWEKNCRTCINVKLMDKGEWGCKKYPEFGSIPMENQLKGCRDYITAQKV